jgi:hypothetical protein
LGKYLRRVVKVKTSTMHASGRWRAFFFAFASVLVPMLLWSIASPLGSVPDEPSHAIRAAAVVRGQIVSPPLSSDPAIAEADVPKYVAQLHQWTCYARQPLVTPVCNEPVVGDPNLIVETGGSAGTNSPVFYALVGLPTLFMEGTPALYAMRFISAILGASAFGFLVMQLRTLGRARWAIVGAAVASTPMVLYLSGSVNPNGIEALSAVALFATLMALIRDPEARGLIQWERAIGGIVLVTLLLGAKIFALLWLLLVVLAALSFLRKKSLSNLLRSWPVWTLVGGAGIVSLLSLLWFANPPSYLVDGIKPVGALDAFLSLVVRTFEFSNGYVGIFGWLDTPSPRLSDIVWSTLAVVIIVVAMAWGSGRSRWVAAGFSAALVVVPPVVQAVLAPQVGFIWQGRYMLAVFMCLLVACGTAIDSSFAENPLSTPMRRVVIIGLTLVAIGQIVSFAWVLRRYVVGLDGSINTMLNSPLWQPPLGWATLTLLLAVSLISTMVLAYRPWFTSSSRAAAVEGTDITGSSRPAART